MNIRRYIATDMRGALAQVRDSLGEDAVILSSRRTGDSVEVVAAVDAEQARQEPVVAAVPRVTAVAPPAALHATAAPTSNPSSLASVSRGDTLATEVKEMRRLLESQLATLAWNEFAQRSPLRAALLRELAQFGIRADIAATIADKVPLEMPFGRALRLALGLISSEIKECGDHWLEDGGMVAFVGPTGAGKTTVISKLAARWVLRHGPRRIALVSTDSQRFGAHEQMHMVGRLLGVATHAVHDLRELPDQLAALRGFGLVLIDTAGMSPRDTGAIEDLERLAAMRDSLDCALVVGTNAQAGAIEHTFARYRPLQPSACALTKLDEATSLGGTLSALIGAGLPVAYCSNGPRVPEDLAPARAHELALLAQRLARKHGATVDEDLLQRRFGAAGHARA
jgi:flagellar biosynthesis protein FlhF